MTKSEARRRHELGHELADEIEEIFQIIAAIYRRECECKTEHLESAAQLLHGIKTTLRDNK